MGMDKHLYLGPYYECRYPAKAKRIPEVYEIVDEALSEHCRPTGGVSYLTPNQRRKGDPNYKVNEDEETHIDLAALNTAADMAWLAEAYAPEVAKLEKHGFTLTLKWGFHAYFN